MTQLTPEYVVGALTARGVPPHVAQGVTARWMTESNLDAGINEISPTVKGSRGGFGLAQWTGPRRVALEEFAAARGVPPSDPEAQFDFFMAENAGPEKAAWDKVMATKDATEAAKTFTLAWERPGIVNMGHTLKALSGISAQSDYAGGATGGAYRPPGDAPARDPRRLAWAYRTGKMTPEDAALYEKGLADGKIEKPQAKEAAPVKQPDPLEAYAMTAMGRQRAPVQINAPQLLAPRQPGQQEQAPLFNRWQMYQDQQWPGLAG